MHKINITIAIFFAFICCSCSTQTKNELITTPENLVSLAYYGDDTFYSHIITINSNYELIYEIGICNVSIEDSLIYNPEDSIYPSEKRKLSPIEIDQFNYYYTHKDSLRYKNSSIFKGAIYANLFIQNRHVAYYPIFEIDKNILYNFSIFLLNLIDNPYELAIIDDQKNFGLIINDGYQELFPLKKFKKGKIDIIYIDEKENIKIEKYND